MKKLAFLSSIFCLLSFPACAQFSRFTGFVGGGVTPPINPIASRLDVGWNASAGAGINLNHHLGVMLDFTFNEVGINQTALQQAQAPGGSVRVWGFTLDPVVHLTQEGPVDVYVTGGGGIYNRTVEYTQPAIVTTAVFDPWFGFYPAAFSANEVIGSLGQYKGGINGGVGVSLQLRQSKAKLFAEARYHHIFTRNVATDIIPVTFGLRW